MVREFNLINEKGQRYSFMDIKNNCLLTNPEGLGCSFYTEHQQINNSFVPNIRKIEQGVIGGTLNFRNYDNYESFVNFVASAKELKFEYKIPKAGTTSTYYRDITFKSITKSEIQPNGVLSESVIFESKTLWYKPNSINYNIKSVEDEIRWNFKWDSHFSDYEHRNVIIENNGHVDAPFSLEIDGYIEKPCISIYVDNQLINELDFDLDLQSGEKLQYSTQDDNMYIRKVGSSTVNLFNDLDLNNTNFFKIPKGVSTVKLTADTDINNAKLTVYEQYITV